MGLFSLESLTDFVVYETTLEARTPCTTIQTVDDDTVENIEEFLVTLTIPTLPGIYAAYCPAVIIDNDGK